MHFEQVVKTISRRIAIDPFYVKKIIDELTSVIGEYTADGDRVWIRALGRFDLEKKKKYYKLAFSPNPKLNKRLDKERRKHV